MQELSQTLPKERVARRVRHQTTTRLVQVRSVAHITPKMVRVILGGDELAGFVSAAHDDHVKLFFPLPGEDKPALPPLGPNGRAFAEGAPRPPMRDYTPRRYDAAANTLTIDFVLHGEGPATTWAAQAKPGDFLGVGGPRGSFVVPDDFDWYLFAGDESALPAIGRRLGELPATARALVVAEVEDAGEEQQIRHTRQARYALAAPPRPERQRAGIVAVGGARRTALAARRGLCLGRGGSCRRQSVAPHSGRPTRRAEGSRQSRRLLETRRRRGARDLR